MNPGQQLQKVRAWASGHKAILGVGAAGIVVVLAMRNRAGASSAGDVPTDAGVSGGTDPQGATIGGYDSTGSDVYNALQPQIDQTQGLIRQLMARIRRQRRATLRLNRQLRRAQRRRAHHVRGVKTPGTKPPQPRPKKLAPQRGTVTGGAQRRRPRPAPVAAPRAIVTRRPSTMTQVGAGAGVSFRQVAAANRGTRPGTRLPAGTRVTLPPNGRR